MISADSIGEINYNQEELYQLYDIDSIIIRHNESLSDEFDLAKFITVINNKGLKESITQYCSNGELMNIKQFNHKGEILKRTYFEFECTGIKSEQTIYVYRKGLLTQKLTSGNLTPYELKETWQYDSLNRLTDYATYRFGEPAWTEHTDYDTINNTSYLTRVKGYGALDTIFTTETFFNSNGQPVKNINRYDHVIKSEYTFEYDKYGNLSRKFAHFYPSGRIGVDLHYYYSKPYKLDSTWSLAGINSSIYNKAYYEYDHRGLLKKRIHHDNRNSLVDTKFYEYK